MEWAEDGDSKASNAPGDARLGLQPERSRTSVSARVSRASFGFFSLDAVAAMAVGVDADNAVDTFGDLPDQKAIVGRFS